MSDSKYGNVGVPSIVRSDMSMPHDAAAEASVLAAMILSEDAMQDCLISLDETCFYIPSNRKIFATIGDMFNKNRAIDSVSLADSLKSQGELERVGGMPYLIDLCSNTFALAAWKDHSRILKRDSTLRRMIQASAQISALAYDAPENTNEVVDKAEEMILSVTNDTISSNYQTLDKIMGNLYTELGEMCLNQTDSQGIQTGFPGIDKNLLGLRGGQMIVIGARPAVGKTSFALNLAVNAAAGGASVAFFSLEMSSLEIAQRLLAAQSGIDMQRIRGANIQNSQWPQILQATEELSRLDIMIDDTPGTTITEIRAKARRMLHNKENGIVILDYLQLVSAPAGHRSDSRTNEVSEMSRGIKIMAKDLDVPVIALSQLSRASKQRNNQTPQLSDLRESGSIEQDADIVILLDRSATDEEAEREDRPPKGVTRFIIAKNRSGPVATIDLMFLGGKTKFVEVDPYHEE